MKEKNEESKQEQLRTELKGKVDQLIQSFTRDPEEITNFLLFAERFSHYSPANMRLLYAQNPAAKFVAPASVYRKGLPNENGEPLSETPIFIRKGEHALRIWKPTVCPCVRLPDGTWVPASHLSEEGKKRAEAENWERKDVRRFLLVPVFDVAQTDLPPELYPKLMGFGQELPGIDGRITAAIAYAENVLHCEVRENANLGKLRTSVRGLFDPEQNRILLSDMLQGDGKLSTLLHEIGHAELHKDPSTEGRSSVQMELEADLYALLLEQHIGVETTNARKEHLQAHYGAYQSWAADQPKDKPAKLNEPFDNAIRRYQEQLPKLDTYLNQSLQAENQQAKKETNINTDVSAERTATVTDDQAQMQTAQAAAVEPIASEPVAEQPQAGSRYYPIDEEAAKRAKAMNSFFDYKPGSETAEYRRCVDEAVKLAETQKMRVDPIYHAKIDRLLDTYARKLAENINARNTISARVPSVMIAGAGNFPTRQKEKQNAAQDKNWKEWEEIQGLLNKIRSTGMSGVSSDDPNAVSKLESKLEQLEQEQKTMKAVNAYYRQNRTLEGCPQLTQEQIDRLKADMASGFNVEDKPYPSWVLSNNSAEIRRLKERIGQLKSRNEGVYTGWQFAGGRVEANKEANRLQIFFNDKPEQIQREELKANGFRWSPSAGAWQRQLNENAYRAAKRVSCLQPLDGEIPLPTAEQQSAANTVSEEPARKVEDPTKTEQQTPAYSRDFKLSL